MKRLINKIIDVLFTDEYYIARTNVNSSLSMIINFIWALSKIMAGIMTRVYLICVSGFFTLGLGLCKIIYFYGRKNNQNPHRDILKMATVLLLSSLSYGAYMIVLLYFPEEPTDYGLIVSLIITIVAFFKLYFSISGIRKMRKQKEPLVMGIKGVNLSGALANLVLTQSCLFFIIRSDINLHILSIVNAIMGIIAALVSVLISIGMYRLAHNIKIKDNSNN